MSAPSTSTSTTAQLVARQDAYRKLGKEREGEVDPKIQADDVNAFLDEITKRSVLLWHSDKYIEEATRRFAELDEAIRRQPDNADAYVKRAALYRDAGERQEDPDFDPDLAGRAVAALHGIAENYRVGGNREGAETIAATLKTLTDAHRAHAGAGANGAKWAPRDAIGAA
jgi:hypothetical protein